ncbi:Ubiquitin-like-specific protease 1D [Vitis vinifera]|uniref:Ubiquitin-like-specific protease 1D n=1 Tax=Vitis vinifera TaxID=29760 RepID=A0A438EHI1_VITVI|nr:Ubiquitin-like-specific protease 1D [Vitis vinifera]
MPLRPGLSGKGMGMGQTVVLLDEEEPQLIETNQQATKITERMKETKIYYPSREDPESVEILFSDIDCLAPQAYLTSPIMNFYIQ